MVAVQEEQAELLSKVVWLLQHDLLEELHVVRQSSAETLAVRVLAC